MTMQHGALALLDRLEPELTPAEAGIARLMLRANGFTTKEDVMNAIAQIRQQRAVRAKDATNAAA
jgi:hypothetical protein